ncbi:MAG: fimbrillin family protein [Muribaculaceae bacterium]|nr:fimbrillin family protein [Muribaculaceae bacterium]
MAHTPYLHIIVLTTAALSVLSACTSEHTIAGEEPATMALPLAFSASEATSRALTNNDNLTSKPFSVWGYYTSPDGTPSQTTIFQNTEVSFANNRWTYNDIQYWIPGLDYTFIAMHPYEASAMTTYSNGELAIASYKANNADLSKRYDLLTASSFRECRAGSPMGPVALKFTHILALIEF